MSNTALEHRPTFSAIISTPTYQKLIQKTITDPKRASRFVSSITSAVAVNQTLQECDFNTIISGALLGESLNLSPSPQLGQFYLVPFENRNRNCKEAQFILSYRGMIQLALRSGQYKRLNVLAVKAGELISWNPLTEEIQLDLIEDDNVRENTASIGYLASFEYLNGFTKTIYWSREKMESHALRYSKGYATKKGYTFWEKDFDAMAFKTMLRQLISKWGIMSVEMQTATEADGAVVSDGGEVIQQVDETDSPVIPIKEAPQETTESQKEQIGLDDV